MTATAGCTPAPNPTPVPSDPAPARWLMPEERTQHVATWMSFGVTDEIWGRRLGAAARSALFEIAEAIADFEPVKVLVPPGWSSLRSISGLEIIEQDVDDLWIRDTGPTFVHGRSIAGVDFNFNGWGDKQEHEADALVARAVCEQVPVERLTTSLVLEGGALEVDGEGTAIITESCVLNDNRNPGVSKRQVESELYRLLGVTKVIWLPGIAGKDITDGHTDFYARFAAPGVVVAALDTDSDSFD